MQQRIKQLRKQLGLSQSQFALRINKTPGFISLVENGRSSISEATVHDISEAFGVNETWLEEGKGDIFIDGAHNVSIEKEEIGSRILMLRTELGLTRDEFAQEVSCSRNQIYNVEKRKSIPSEKLVKKIAEAFSASYEWLLNGKGTMYEEKNIPETDADRIRCYMLKDSVAREVVLGAMERDRSIWLKIDRLLRNLEIENED